MPIDYYASTLGCQVDFRVFFDLLEETLPDLYAHIQETKLNLEVCCVRWFVCLLCVDVNKENSLAIWDLFLLKGP